MTTRRSFGIQAARLVSGKSVELRTPTGTPSNPVLIGLEAPQILLFGPRLWILGAP
jgi:hypothetical protein